MSTPSRAPQRPRLGRPRLLIVGCGDVGRRIVARLHTRFRLFGTAHSAAGMAAVRAAGAIAVPLELEAIGRNRRLAALAPRVLMLAPSSPTGEQDRRVARLLRHLEHRRGNRLVYFSTTGVYGDRGGAWIDETASAAPGNARARRRLDAERRLRASRWRASVLRVPGIYAADRLPVERLRLSIPVALSEQDVYTNHIHADDLARAAIAAMFRGAPARVYHAVDDSQMLLGQFLDRIADHTGLKRPARVAWDELERAAGPQRMSFMRESRRLRNVRMKRELRLRLLYPDVESALAGAALACDQTSKSPSTDR